MCPRDNEHIDGLEGASYRELRLLEKVESTPEVSQRRLAHELGIALGVANVLVRNLAKKGYIRASKVRWQRWIYVLTPAGIARKVHLTVAYIERFLDHYRRVRELVREDLGSLAMDAESRIAIYGTTEMAEIVYLALRELGISRIDVFDRDGRASFLGMPVLDPEMMRPGDYARVMVAYNSDLERSRQELEDHGFTSEQIVALLQNSKHETRPTNLAEPE